MRGALPFAAMQEAGVLAVVQRDGWQYNSNGAILRPETTCPKVANPVSQPQDSCGCDTGGGVNCPYEPRGGYNLGYPVTGSVAVNYGSNGVTNTNYWQGAIYIGDAYPSGPHIGLPQIGWGTKVVISLTRCLASSGEQLIQAACAMIAWTAAHPNWNAQVTKAVTGALARWGPTANWAIAAAADFVITLSADLVFATFSDFVLAAGVGLTIYKLIDSVIICMG
jgi:hypothetical protein